MSLAETAASASASAGSVGASSVASSTVPSSTVLSSNVLEEESSSVLASESLDSDAVGFMMRSSELEGSETASAAASTATGHKGKGRGRGRGRGKAADPPIMSLEEAIDREIGVLQKQFECRTWNELADHMIGLRKENEDLVARIQTMEAVGREVVVQKNDLVNKLERLTRESTEQLETERQTHAEEVEKLHDRLAHTEKLLEEEQAALRKEREEHEHTRSCVMQMGDQEKLRNELQKQLHTVTRDYETKLLSEQLERKKALDAQLMEHLSQIDRAKQLARAQVQHDCAAEIRDAAENNRLLKQFISMQAREMYDLVVCNKDLMKRVSKLKCDTEILAVLSEWSLRASLLEHLSKSAPSEQLLQHQQQEGQRQSPPPPQQQQRRVVEDEEGGEEKKDGFETKSPLEAPMLGLHNSNQKKRSEHDLGTSWDERTGLPPVLLDEPSSTSRQPTLHPTGRLGGSLLEPSATDTAVESYSRDRSLSHHRVAEEGTMTPGTEEAGTARKEETLHGDVTAGTGAMSMPASSSAVGKTLPNTLAATAATQESIFSGVEVSASFASDSLQQDSLSGLPAQGLGSMAHASISTEGSSTLGAPALLQQDIVAPVRAPSGNQSRVRASLRPPQQQRRHQRHLEQQLQQLQSSRSGSTALAAEDPTSVSREIWVAAQPEDTVSPPPNAAKAASTALALPMTAAQLAMASTTSPTSVAAEHDFGEEDGEEPVRRARGDSQDGAGSGAQPQAPPARMSYRTRARAIARGRPAASVVSALVTKRKVVADTQNATSMNLLGYNFVASGAGAGSAPTGLGQRRCRRRAADRQAASGPVEDSSQQPVPPTRSPQQRRIAEGLAGGSRAEQPPHESGAPFASSGPPVGPPPSHNHQKHTLYAGTHVFPSQQMHPTSSVSGEARQASLGQRPGGEGDVGANDHGVRPAGIAPNRSDASIASLLTTDGEHDDGGLDQEGHALVMATGQLASTGANAVAAHNTHSAAADQETDRRAAGPGETAHVIQPVRPRMRGMAVGFKDIIPVQTPATTLASPRSPTQKQSSATAECRDTPLQLSPARDLLMSRAEDSIASDDASWK